MSTDVNKRIEALSRLCEIAWSNFDRRRSYEWKFSIAIWTAITAFIALTLQGKISPPPPKHAFWTVAFLIWGLQVIFQCFVKLSNRVEQKKALKYEELLNDAIEQEFKDTRGKLLKLAKGWWSFIIHISVTLILIISAGFAIYRNTNTAGEKSISGSASIFNMLMAMAAIGSAIFAGCVWRIVKKTMIHQALLDVQKDYRSPQMLYAVRTLWEFHKTHGKQKLVEKYEETRRREEEWVSGLNQEKRIEAEQSTLHCQRRLVSHFYEHLAALYVNRIIPKGVVYKIWSEPDLRIIPDVLIPIENQLRKVLYTPPLGPLDENCNLLILYRDSKNY